MTPFWEWKGCCKECGKLKQPLQGLFCHNFCHSRGSWRPCHSVWCGDCYTSYDEIKFHIAEPENDEGVVWKRKKDEFRYKRARNGDMLLSPFQCDLCWFRNLMGRDPMENKMSDKFLLVFIRRANLDMLWSASPYTVNTNRGNALKGLRMCDDLGITPTYESMGPWPLEDNMGFTVALMMLKSSLLPGKHNKEYQQFDTIRSLRTAFSNVYEASVSGSRGRSVLRGAQGVTLHPSFCPTQSLFFEKFIKGILSRMDGM